MDTMQILLSLATAVIGGLSTAVVHLYRKTNELGEKLDGISHVLGFREGFLEAVRSCGGGTPCPMKDRVPQTAAGETFNLKKP